MKRRLQPLAGANFTLVTKPVLIGPAPALHEEGDGFFDLALIRVALFDHSYGNAVRAENDLRTLRAIEPRQGFVHFLNQCLQIKFVTVEGIDAVDWNIAAKQAAPLVKAAAGGGARILRIKRKQHNLVAAR